MNTLKTAFEGILIKDMKHMRNIIITGGVGFIGSHLVRLFVNKYPDYNKGDCEMIFGESGLDG